MNVRWFPPPSSGKGRMEPFGYLAADGELNVLYRKADGNAGGSSIARLRPKPDNILKRSRAMLEVERDHAYPYVVLINGVPHVLRTVRREGTTDLYRVNDANDGLDPVAVLLDVALHSPTLFEHAGRWRLLGTQEPLRDAPFRARDLERQQASAGPQHAAEFAECGLHVLEMAQCEAEGEEIEVKVTWKTMGYSVSVKRMSCKALLPRFENNRISFCSIVTYQEEGACFSSIDSDPIFPLRTFPLLW